MNRLAGTGRFIAHFYPAHRRAIALRHTSEPLDATSYPAFGKFIECRQGLASTRTLTLLRSCAIRGRGLRETLRYASCVGVR
jgi:hypothetical protein